MNNLYLLGRGGHSRSVSEAAVDGRLAKTVTVLSLEEFELSYEKLSLEDGLFLVAIGDIHTRSLYFEKLLLWNLPVASVVAETATVAHDVDLGDGCVIMPTATLRTGVTISVNTIINTGAIVEHDCVIGKSCNISPGVVLCGTCRIGSNVFVGAGAVISDGVKICDDVIVGAGAVVLDDIGVPGTYVGCPATRVG